MPESDIPHWVSLFDGDVYRHYQHLNSSQQTSSSTESYSGFRAETPPDDIPEVPTGHTGSSHSCPGSESLASVFTISPLGPSSDSLRPLAETKKEDVDREKKAVARSRRTCLYIALGILALSVVAMVTTLFLHFRPTKQVSVHMENVATTAGDTAFTLECQVRNLPNLQQVTISRDGGKDYLALLTLRPALTQWVKDTSRMLLRPVYSQDSVTVILSVDFPNCHDEDEYECRAVSENGVSATTATVTIRVPPKDPEVHLPVEIVEGRPFRVRNVWRGGYPALPGFLVVRRYDRVQSYLPAPAFSDYTESVWRENCTLVLESSYLFLPNMTWNNTGLRVNVLPHPGLPQVERRDVERLAAASEQVLVLRVDYCTGAKPNSFLPHPYTCTKFVHCRDGAPYVFACKPGLCYDRASHSCLPTE